MRFVFDTQGNAGQEATLRVAGDRRDKWQRQMLATSDNSNDGLCNNSNDLTTVAAVAAENGAVAQADAESKGQKEINGQRRC